MDIDRILDEQGRSRRISRRDLLKRGGILAGAAIGMPAILAACAPDAPATPADTPGDDRTRRPALARRQPAGCASARGDAGSDENIGAGIPRHLRH